MVGTLRRPVRSPPPVPTAGHPPRHRRAVLAGRLRTPSHSSRWCHAYLRVFFGSLDRPTSEVTTDVTLVWLLAALALVPLLSLPLTGAIGRRAGYPLGVIFLLIAAMLVPAAAKVVRGEVIAYKIAWVPELGLNLSLRLDGLALVFIALALIIGRWCSSIHRPSSAGTRAASI